MEVQSAARWGILVYSSASPDIAPAAQASLDDVLKTPLADGVQLAAQLGTAQEIRRVCSAAGKDFSMPSEDMSVRSTLEDFLRWGMKAVPAERYLLVLGGHGSGFMGSVSDTARRHVMPPQETRAALRDVGLSPDVLVLNSCLEGNTEVASELAPEARYIVASQGLQAGKGIPLAEAFSHIVAQTRPIDAARYLVEAASHTPQRVPMLSALDESQAGAVGAALNVLGDALIRTPGALGIAREQISAMRDFREGEPWDHPLVDLKDVRALTERLAGDARLQGTAVVSAARALDQAVASMVVASTATDVSADGVAMPRPDAHGLSVYVPAAPLRIPIAVRQYDELALSAQAPRWHEAVKQLGGGTVEHD